MSRKTLTTEEFIKRAKLKHGDKYDYSLVNYTVSKNKIQIICKTHGVFEQRPDSHLTSGCFKCFNDNRTSSTKEFIRKARQMYGEKYNYSLVEYKTSTQKIKIICKDHGIFEQLAGAHLQHHGCPKCHIDNLRYSINEFINLARNIHGDKYDYSLVKYINNITKIKIICKEHGIFKQSPTLHLNGKAGCTKCGDVQGGLKIRSNTKEFIKNANIVHNNQYDYTLTEYTTSRNKLKIICKEHGIFQKIADNHLSGQGCPTCGLRNGNIKRIEKSKDVIFPMFYNRYTNRNKFTNLQCINGELPCKLYVLEISNGFEFFYKIGITTNNIKIRINNIKKYYINVNPILIINLTRQMALNLEQNTLYQNEHIAYKPKIKFAGWTECFSTIPKIQNLS